MYLNFLLTEKNIFLHKMHIYKYAQFNEEINKINK